MIPGENILPTNTRFEPFKLFQNGTKSNVSTKTNIASNVHMDELLKTQILRKKEKYAIDCPLCKAKVLPFRIDFNSVIFLCVNQECHFPFGENVKDFQCVRKEMKKKSNQIKEKLTKNKKNNKDGKSVKLEESKTTITEDSLSFT